VGVEYVYYSNKGGLGIITQNETIDSLVNKTPTSVLSKEINPTDKTDMFGFYTAPMAFVGMLKDKPSCMVFHAGSDDNMFDKVDYYYCLYRIAEDRLCNSYSPLTARDFIFVNNKWK
jgi:hypothetical protein